MRKLPGGSLSSPKNTQRTAAESLLQTNEHVQHSQHKSIVLSRWNRPLTCQFMRMVRVSPTIHQQTCNLYQSYDFGRLFPSGFKMELNHKRKSFLFSVPTKRVYRSRRILGLRVVSISLCLSATMKGIIITTKEICMLFIKAKSKKKASHFRHNEHCPFLFLSFLRRTLAVIISLYSPLNPWILWTFSIMILSYMTLLLWISKAEVFLFIFALIYVIIIFL